MVRVIARKDESFQRLFNRFRKAVNRSGVRSEVRKRRYFVSKSEQRRMDEKKSRRRRLQKQRKYQSNHRH
ncbi:MAG: 30S ribosomal protein S21 [Anaerolineaceae bacterium]|nr:30S ribosomal protein S21 [Anaerolineaceae bacterium]